MIFPPQVGKWSRSDGGRLVIQTAVTDEMGLPSDQMVDDIRSARCQILGSHLLQRSREFSPRRNRRVNHKTHCLFLDTKSPQQIREDVIDTARNAIGTPPAQDGAALNSPSMGQFKEET